MAIGALGNPVVSYRSFGGDLVVAVCRDPLCHEVNERVVDSAGDVGAWSSIAIGDDGLVVVAYHDVTNGDLKFARCLDLRCDNDNVRTLDSTGSVGTLTSIAIRPNGNPVISYIDETNQRVKLALCGDPTCATVTIRPITPTGNLPFFQSSTSVAIASNGNPIVAHTAGASVRLTTCNNPDCTTGTLRTIETGAGVPFASITVGADGNPLIGFGLSGALKVAVCNDPVCGTSTIRVVDDFASSGTYVSITTRDDGIPVFSYARRAPLGSLDLAVAICTDTACSSAQRTLVDSVSGFPTSVVIGNSGHPVVAHGGAGGYPYMAVTVCGNPTCTPGTPRNR